MIYTFVITSECAPINLKPSSEIEGLLRRNRCIRKRKAQRMSAQHIVMLNSSFSLKRNQLILRNRC
ncbi:hypothetical protein X989_4710 [Burkholderia pseudomallei MSHR4378]|nr:hypothetical protein X989_4710 [Burkholderia pseudomallei MSHR4378]